MARVLYINTPPRQCGVNHFGETVGNLLVQSIRHEVVRAHLAEDTSIDAYLAQLRTHQPKIVLYNYHPTTMGWLDQEVLMRARAELPGILHAGIGHDRTPPFPQLAAVIRIDPTFIETPREMRVRRLVPEFNATTPAPRNVIGSFGLPSWHKGFARLIRTVNDEFAEATVRLHIPFGHYGDPDGKRALEIVDECRRLAKPGIKLEITHDYRSPDQLLEWLAGNSINCFLYDSVQGAGVSSVIDAALAVGRPIAISDSNMFRHLVQRCPECCINGRTLKSIMSAGFGPLEAVRQDWSAANVLKDYERVIDVMMERSAINIISNRVLTPEDREALKPVIEELRILEPGIMSRKIPQAVFQNAYVFQQIKLAARKEDEIILVGGYEDPIGPALQRLGYNVRITDPDPKVDGKDARDVWLESLQETGKQYDIVVSCSVIEHVVDDESFIYYLYSLIKPGGVCFLTTDYREDYYEGMHKPDTDVRFYTSERLRHLASLVPDGALLDPPTWSYVPPYFEIVGAHYGFCALAYRKKVEVPYEQIADKVVQHHVRSQAEKIRYCQDRMYQLYEEVNHLKGDVAIYKYELARFGPVYNASPSTIRAAGTMHKVVRRFPVASRVVAKLLRFAKRAVRKVGLR